MAPKPDHPLTTAPLPARLPDDSTHTPAQHAPPLPSPSQQPHTLFSPRGLRQLGLFCAGAGLMVGSIAISRRAVARRKMAAMPAFLHATVPPSGAARAAAAAAAAGTKTTAAASSAAATPAGAMARTAGAPAPALTAEHWRAEGSVMAAEALALATLNVAAFAVMLAGGLAWAFDLSSVADLRARARLRLHRQTGGEADDDDGALDREVEEWAAGWLARVGVVVEGDGRGGKDGVGGVDGSHGQDEGRSSS